MRVLVTGAAGSIGRTLVAGLPASGHEVVGLDLLPDPAGATAWHVADCTDPDAVDAAVAAQPLDAVVHLAGDPGETSLPDALSGHVVSTGALLDAMLAHGVGRMVYASSNHAVGRHRRTELDDGLLTVDVRPRPDTFYGVGKVAAEALMSLYADRYGLDVLACRIGSFEEHPTTVRHLSTWLSPDDCVRMVHACLTTPAPGWAVLHGISANTRAWWDLEPGRRLGYEPADDAEEYAALVEARADDAAENAVVGGPTTFTDLERPALDRPQS
ncbi:NAD(P)-dependent oxidoreductase [Nocardioides sp. CFH 31398]|uniref:NAD-dependent epimerase/dehydratase family protein n=1 Tax=Nocardioides sp. CFH 31398 TaxID=2919579 RepID=UPI001F064522|nr:NAD(P)-dependent oxidoreductase [Nocardioides sp. CFH 31398]MCH1866364.1 NAD(P)-dependent oxidoreductase [Nocardioides sp. CFH 31398]